VLVKVLTPTSTPKTKSLSRSLLPKLNYSKQISVNQATFSQWVKQVKVYTYSRRWPSWCTSVGGSKIWDGVDSDSDECIARREAYEWMETSIPETSKYILIFVKEMPKLFTKLCGEDLPPLPLKSYNRNSGHWR
jgi:hypothetical protein